VMSRGNSLNDGANKDSEFSYYQLSMGFEWQPWVLRGNETLDFDPGPSAARGNRACLVALKQSPWTLPDALGVCLYGT
jgi:hypothetical protein